MDPKIFVTYHKETHIVNTGILEPIQVGDGPSLAGCRTRDNSGENISSLNDRYCEMTAVYWAWKNLSGHSHIGLMHYRRFLDFNENRLHLDQWGVVNWPTFTTDFESRFGLNDAAITTAIKGYDIVLPKQWSVRSAGFRNLRDHYNQSPFHHGSDLTLCRDVITLRYSEFLPYWNRALASSLGWFNNIFVLRTDLFDAYCSWLFPLLADIEKRIPFDRYSAQEKRVMGYLSERLFNVWIYHLLDFTPNLRVHELDRVFVTDPTPKVWDPAIRSSQDKVISIVIASDDNYVPHLGALMASIFDNISPDACVDLLILDGGICQDNQDMLKRLAPTLASIYFIPMSDEFTSFFTHMHFSRATFYRLILDSMLVSRDKVIYIDCDTIVLGNLCELWDVDMADKPIAAVHDYIMEHFCNSHVLSADFAGSLPARRYLTDYVGIPARDCDQYFQAGVLIMNLRKLRELGLSKRMVESLLARKYWFLDQDVLNKYFCAAHVSLPAEWNFVNCTDDISHSLDHRRAMELKDARCRLKIIHYAGYEAKPWVNRSAFMGEYYFYYLRRTYWYEQVLGLRDGGLASGQPSVPFRALMPNFRQMLRKLWRQLPWFVRRVCNPAAYAVRRRLKGG
jgi:lipopolysaccharide biosynthesis glycosyltransferase